MILAAFVANAALQSAHAGTIEITTDMVIDAGNSFPDDTLVVLEGNDGLTTITLVDGGLVDGITLEEMSHLEMTGGTLTGGFRRGGLHVSDGSSAIVSGGLLTGGTATASGRGDLVLTGDVIVESIVGVSPRGHVLISGGTMSDPIVVDTRGTLEITGGQIMGEISSILSGSVFVSGGSFFGANTDPTEFRIYDFSTLHVRGFDLEISNGFLIGTLADGNPLNNPIEVGEDASVVLWIVPEPDTIASATLTFGVLLLWNFNHRHGRRNAITAT